jgi:crotonobetainyl-CoA:carnitine CoA-transferase CaiB-like acyl-CoA transferase
MPIWRRARGSRSVRTRTWALSSIPAIRGTRTHFELKWRRPVPSLGEHNDYVYKEILGYSQAQMDDLNERGLIGTVQEREA